jgi:Tfp pilus assembly protein PilO
VSGLGLWRDRWRTWVPALAFFVLNLAALAVYQFAYAGRVDALAGRVETLRGSLRGLAGQRAELEAKVALVEANRTRIAELYRDRFSTEKVRLTKTLAEFKALATRAGLRPESITYPEQDLAQFGLVKKSIIFGVSGSYASLRQLIHLLDLSPTFFTLEEVRLNGANSGQGLDIALRMSTLFVNENAPNTRAPERPLPIEPAPSPPAKPEAKETAAPSEEAL